MSYPINRRHFVTALTVPLIPSAATPQAPHEFNIANYGAVADGTTINTVAIQKAIDACFAAGGGRVLVPAGVFLTGSVQLRSRVILKVADGAILRGSPNIVDYAVKTAPHEWGGFWSFINTEDAQCLVYAEDSEQVGIEGPGTIDGQGGNLRKVFPNPTDPKKRKPQLVRYQHCRGITMHGVTLLDPAMFASFYVHSQDIDIDGVKVRSRHTVTADGLDFNGCRNVRIRNCDLDCGDDAISPKTLNPAWPNENFTISNCKMSTEWAAIRLGPESIGDMRHFDVHDCVFTDCRDGIKIESCEGALFEDLSFRNIEMRDVNRPIYVTATRFRFSGHSKSLRPPVGRIRGLKISDVRAVARRGDPSSAYDRACAAVAGWPGASIEDVTLTNVHLTLPGGGTAQQAGHLDVPENLHFNEYPEWARPFDADLPGSVLYLRHLRGVHLDNVHLTVQQPDARPFLAGDDVERLSMKGVVGSAPSPVPGLAKLAGPQPIATVDCTPNSVIALSADEQQRLDAMRRHAAVLDRELQKSVDLADAAARASLLLALPDVWQSGAGSHTLQFEAPAFTSGRKVYLRFGAVDGACRVSLNGKSAGERSTDPVAYLKTFPLALDVTTLLKPGAPNHIEITGAGFTPPVELRQATT
ncbi:MAG: glycosyl hydrolase family 28 protein [Bryobacteraceae bacterium]